MKSAPRTAAEPAAIQDKTPRRISLVRLLVPHWKAFSLGPLGALGSGLADLLQPLPIKIVIDNALGSRPMPAWLAPGLETIFGTNKLAILNFAAVSVVGIALLSAISSY